jgi:hypothetical protein
MAWLDGSFWRIDSKKWAIFYYLTGLLPYITPPKSESNQQQPKSKTKKWAVLNQGLFANSLKRQKSDRQNGMNLHDDNSNKRCFPKWGGAIPDTSGVTEVYGF